MRQKIKLCLLFMLAQTVAMAQALGIVAFAILLRSIERTVEADDALNAAQGAIGSRGATFWRSLYRASEALDDVASAASERALLLSAIAVVAILITSILLTLFISRLYLTPVSWLSREMSRIADGDLDHPVDAGWRAAVGAAAAKRLSVDGFGDAGRTGDSGGERTSVSDAISAFDSVERIRVTLKNAVRERLRFEDERKLLVATVSHDLRTPVTAIKGYAEGLRDGVAVDSATRERYISTILGKARDVEILVDELIDYARFGLDVKERSYKRTRYDVWLKTEFEALSAASARDAAGNPPDQNAKITYEDVTYDSPQDKGIWVSMDEPRFRRMIGNIVQNCFKYARRPGEPTLVRAFMGRDGSVALLEVRDNGPGIPEDDLPRIFDMFYTVDGAVQDKRTKGYGIGLAIAKEVAEAHGGQIWARPSPDGGVSIFISLPALEAVNDSNCAVGEEDTGRA